MHRRCHLTWAGVAAVAVALTVPATSALASLPAVDQYTQHLPTGRGAASTLAKPPLARPGQLPPGVRSALSGPRDRQLLTLATARSLGAVTPQNLSGGVKPGGSESLATSLGDAAGTAPGLALIGILAAIATAGAWFRFSRHRSTQSEGT